MTAEVTTEGMRWAVFRDHPQTKDIAYVRHADGTGIYEREIATLYNDACKYAELVAAAPELLALARKVASECADCGGSAEKVRAHGPGPEDEYSEPCAGCADIWAVINKAEGKL